MRISARAFLLAVVGALGIAGSEAIAADPFALDDAYRETVSPQRIRISLNGAWRFQPARDLATPPAPLGWATLRVPGRWDPASYPYGGFVVQGANGAALADWNGIAWANIATAWYEREIAIPADWSKRRVTLVFEHIGRGVDERITEYGTAPETDEGLRSNAVVVFNGRRVEPEDEWRVDVSGLLRPGATNTLTIGVRSRGGGRWGKGLNGDVWLESEPRTRLLDVNWRTTKADASLALAVTAKRAEPDRGTLGLHATVDGKIIAEIPPTPPDPDGVTRFSLRAAVPDLAPWSEFDPRLTPLRLELIDNGTVVDTITKQIAMRDWRTAGDKIVLNGRPVALRTESGPSIGAGMEIFDRDFVGRYLAAYRAANYNGIRGYWGRAPEHVYEICDRLGLMVQHVVPSPAMFRARSGLRDEAAFWPSYERALAASIARPRGHVGVVAYVIWAHEAVDRLQNEPTHLDGVWTPPAGFHDRERAELLRAADILRRLDPSREVLFDEAGNLGNFVDLHPYFDFSIPLQEWEDWPERRQRPVKPLHASEFSLPYVLAWGEWDPLTWESANGGAFVIENAARFLGDAAYTRSRSSMLAAGWAASGQRHVAETALDPGLTQHGADATVHRPNEAAEEVAALIAQRVFRAWRAARVHVGPFGHDTMTGAAMLFRPRRIGDAAPDAMLKTPGPKPDRDALRGEIYLDSTLPVAAGPERPGGPPPFLPTRVFDATHAAFVPLLAFIGGGGEAGLTSKDHAYAAGETVEKSVVVVNDGPDDERIAGAWRLVPAAGGAPVLEGEVALTAPQGMTSTRSIRFAAPDVAERSAFRLVLAVATEGGESRTDAFDLQVFPSRPRAPHLPDAIRIGLYDTVGLTAKALDSLGVRYQRVVRLDTDLKLDLLIIGALSLDAGAQRLLPQVERGLDLLLFEQRIGAMAAIAAYTGSSFDTTHMAASLARTVFPTDAAHPVLAGLAAEDLRDWRGTSDLVPAFAPASGTNHLFLPGGTAKFKGSNRGIVSSYVLPKPQRGNFRVILSSGFDLRQTPLLEYFVGSGRVMLMQLDVTRRHGTDPVARRIIGNAVSYMAAKTPLPVPAAYLGDTGGRALFDDLGARYATLGTRFPDEIAGHRTILVGSGGATALKARRDKVLDWVAHGGRLVLAAEVAAGLEAGWFPGKIVLARERTLKCRLSDDPILRGLAQSDAYFRDGLEHVVIRSGRHGGEASPVQVLRHGDGVIVILPLRSDAALPRVPKPSSEKLARLASTVLTNAGVALGAPFRLVPETAELAGDWRFRTDPQDRGEASGWQGEKFDDGNWRLISVPGFWGFQGVTEKPSPGGFAYDGAAWYRRTVTIPAEWKDSAAPLKLVIGGVADTGKVFWQGRLVATGADRSYFREEVAIPIDRELIPYGGKVVIAIKVVDKGPAGGIAGAVRIEQDTGFLTPRLPVAYGERFVNFDPDSYRSW